MLAYVYCVLFVFQTISDVVNRVTTGQMRKVARAGLDPRTNVPLSVKALKGGLKIVQALQNTWQNSQMGMFQIVQVS